MVRQHHQLNGQKFGQTPEGSGGQKESSVLQSKESQRVEHKLATEQQHIINIEIFGSDFLELSERWTLNIHLLGISQDSGK